MNTTYIKSSFGIDVSKKIILKSSNQDMVSAWAKGSIDPNSLKKVSISYNENFTKEGFSEEVNKAVNDILGGGINLIKKSASLVRGLTLGGTPGEAITAGTDSSASGLTSAILELGTAISIANEVSGKAGASDDLNGLINAAIGQIPKYNVPSRSAIPGLTIDFGDSLKINFNYGSCGIFNAKEEVYDPIKTIMTSVKNIKSSGNSITFNETTSSLPFSLGNFVAKREAIKYFTNSVSSGSTTSKLKNVLSDTTSSLKGVTSLSKNTKKLLDLQTEADQFFDDTKELPDYNKVFEGKYLTSDINETNPTTFGKITAHVKNFFEGGDSNIKYPKEGSAAEAALEEGVLKDVENEDKYQKLTGHNYKSTRVDFQTGREITENLGAPWKSKYVKNYDKNVDKINQQVDENIDTSFFSQLKSLVSIQPEAVSEIVAQAYNSAKTNEWELRLGWVGPNGSTIYYTIDDITSGILSNTIQPSLTIKGIPQSVQCSFDYSNIDKDGYPKSGSITISKLWIMDPLGSFDTTFKR